MYRRLGLRWPQDPSHGGHRSQYPIDPSMFPDPILREMFGVEYFTQILPERELDNSLLND